MYEACGPLPKQVVLCICPSGARRGCHVSTECLDGYIWLALARHVAATVADGRTRLDAPRALLWR